MTEAESPVPASGAALLAEALRLQHTRCETYRLFDAELARVLSASPGPSAAAAAAAFDAALAGAVVPAFRSVSGALRRLEAAAAEGPGTDGPGTDRPGTDRPGTDRPGTDRPGTDRPGTDRPGTDRLGTEGPGTEGSDTDGPRRFLCRWVDRAQSAEAAHLRTAAALAQAITRHHADPLHDRERCPLRSIAPAPALEVLSFVPCDGASSFGSAKEEEEEEEKGEEEDDDTGERATAGGDDGKSDDLLVSCTLASGKHVRYNPAEVRQRCAAFAAEAVPLWKARQRMRQELQEWTEELQAELADA